MMKIMKVSVFLLLCRLPASDAFFLEALFAWLFPGNNNDEPYEVEPLGLSERLLRLSKDAIDLNTLAYKAEIDVADAGYDYWRYFEAEPDQAIVAAVNGYCFAAFRGSILTIEDQIFNFVPGLDSVCDKEDPQMCCNVRWGAAAAYNSVFRDELEAALQECLTNHASCDDDADENPNCLVFTGYSQGAAIAHVAALRHSFLDPLVLTFGQRVTVAREGCDLVPSDRIYRWVNTFSNHWGLGILAYDNVAGASAYPEASQFGHMLVLPPQNTLGVAYFGLDPPESVWQLSPGDTFAHLHEDLIWDTAFYPGYREHLAYLVTNVQEYPFLLSGFIDGSLCSKDYECQSGTCQSRFLAPSVCS